MLKFYKGPWPKRSKMESLVNVDQDLGYKKTNEENQENIEIVVTENLKEEQIIISKKKDDVKSKKLIQEDMFIDEIVIDPINPITTKTRYDPNEQNQEMENDITNKKVTSFDNSISSETKVLDGETKSESEEKFGHNSIVETLYRTPENFANLKENYTAKVKNSNITCMKIHGYDLKYFSEQALMIFQASLPTSKVKKPKVENLIKSQNIQCECCDLNFPSIKSLKIHLEEIHEKNADEIHEISQNCLITSVSASQVKKPKVENLIKSQNIQCECCDLNFPSIKSLKIHLKDIHEKNPDEIHEISQNCLITSVSASLLSSPKIGKLKASAAEKVKQPTNPKYIFRAKKIHCEFCNMNLMEMESFTDHLRKIHKKTTEEIIEIRKNYEMVVVEEETEILKKTNSEKLNNVQDEASNNSNVISKLKKKYPCEFCTMSFKYKKSFLKHLEECHVKTTAEIKEIMIKYELDECIKKKETGNTSSEQTKLYSCEFCTMSFKYQKSFLKHSEIHKETAQNSKSLLKLPYKGEGRLGFGFNLTSADQHITTNKFGNKFVETKTTFENKNNQEVGSSIINKILYKCSICQSEFDMIRDLNQHIKQNHFGSSNENLCNTIPELPTSTIYTNSNPSRSDDGPNGFELVAVEETKNIQKMSKMKNEIVEDFSLNDDILDDADQSDFILESSENLSKNDPKIVTLSLSEIAENAILPTMEMTTDGGKSWKMEENLMQENYIQNQNEIPEAKSIIGGNTKTLEEEFYTCEFCAMDFAHVSLRIINFKIHLSEHHNKTKNEIKNVLKTYRNNKKTELQNMIKKEYQCGFCPISYCFQGVLQKHIGKIHAIEKYDRLTINSGCFLCFSCPTLAILMLSKSQLSILNHGLYCLFFAW